MNDEDEAFVRTIVDRPGDDTARLVYADWLDERDDPRSAYLRAELEWARTGKKVRALRSLAKQLDPVWVARVSRPPVGVCLRWNIFADIDSRELPTREAVERVVLNRGFPHEYAGFLLNYGGGDLLDVVDVDEFTIEGFASLSGGLTIDELIENIEFPHEDEDSGCETNFYNFPPNRLPVAYSGNHGIGDYFDAVVLVTRKRGNETRSHVEYYSNPLANDVPFDEASSPRRCFSRLASSFGHLLAEIEAAFEPDE